MNHLDYQLPSRLMLLHSCLMFHDTIQVCKWLAPELYGWLEDNGVTIIIQGKLQTILQNLKEVMVTNNK